MNFQLFDVCLKWEKRERSTEYILISRREEILIPRLPLSSDLAKRIVGRIKKTMYHESRSRILARFQVLLEEKHSVNTNDTLRYTFATQMRARRIRNEKLCSHGKNFVYHTPKSQPPTWITQRNSTEKIRFSCLCWCAYGNVHVV